MAPLLRDDQKQGLVQAPSREEIKIALFGINDDKAPSPDGFSSKFFKKTWHITGDDFMDVVS